MALGGGWGCSWVQHLWKKGRKQPWSEGGGVYSQQKPQLNPLRVLKLDGLLSVLSWGEGQKLHTSVSASH